MSYRATKKAPAGVFEILAERRLTVAGAEEQTRIITKALDAAIRVTEQRPHLGMRDLASSPGLLLDVRAEMLDFCPYCSPASVPPRGFDVYCLARIVEEDAVTDYLQRAIGKRLHFIREAMVSTRRM